LRSGDRVINREKLDRVIWCGEGQLGGAAATPLDRTRCPTPPAPSTELSYIVRLRRRLHSRVLTNFPGGPTWPIRT
jgi:hypothetical protein